MILQCLGQICPNCPCSVFVFCVYFVSIVGRAMQGDAEMASGAKSEATRSDAHSPMHTILN